MYSKLFMCPLDVKRPKCFRDFTPLNPPQDAAMNSLRSLHFATFENSIFVQKQTLVKLLG